MLLDVYTRMVRAKHLTWYSCSKLSYMCVLLLSLLLPWSAALDSSALFGADTLAAAVCGYWRWLESQDSNGLCCHSPCAGPEAHGCLTSMEDFHGGQQAGHHAVTAAARRPTLSERPLDSALAGKEDCILGRIASRMGK